MINTKATACIDTFYIEKYIFLTGLITNAICILAFCVIIRRTSSQGNMFKYLLMKSLMDLLHILPEYLYYSYSLCESSKKLSCVVISIWLYEYFEFAIKILSILFLIAATFECYLKINKKLKFCQNNLFFFIISITLIVISFLLYLIFSFQYTIKKTIRINRVNNKTTIYYSYYLSKFGIKLENLNLYFLNSLTRDFTLLVILVILNVLIIITLIEKIKIIRNLAGNTNIDNNSIQKKECKQMIMIIAIGFNYMIGHLPFFIFYFFEEYFHTFVKCSFEYTNLLLYLSYVDGIIFYFFLNDLFRKILTFRIFIARNS
jgi:hypothetical protein